MKNEIYAIVIHVYMDYWEDDILFHLYLLKVQLFPFKQLEV
jgi:hypothetical protein